MEILLEIIFLVGIILLPVAVILLQIFLSKRENRWTGLILPTISFLFSIIGILGSAFFYKVTTNSTTTYSISNESISQIIMQAIIIFLLMNIPTVILTAIYFACREKSKKNREIDKMNINDLN